MTSLQSSDITRDTSHRDHPPVAINSDTFARIYEFYTYETMLLDGGDLSAWLAVLDKDLDYKIFIRVNRELGDASVFSQDTYHLDDNFEAMRFRIRRFTETRTAWAENPPSRTRRFVTNIVARELNEREYLVTSSVLLLRSRQTGRAPEFFSALRRDTIRVSGDTFKIVTRHIFPDEALLSINNLSSLV